jgi:hypothetical protein
MSIFMRETGELDRLEGEIREFVRRDTAAMRRHAESGDTLVTDNICSLLQRVCANSVQEIEEVITRLEILRDGQRDQAARVQRQIEEYASLSQAALHSAKVIAENLRLWGKAPGAPNLSEGI